MLLFWSNIFIAFSLLYALDLNPVILIPGDGGSRMEAKLRKNDTSQYICSKTTSSWFNIWLNVELLIPYVINCWVDNVKLTYDNTTRKTLNTPGVDIRIPDFGNTSSVEWLDPSHRSYSRYFALISQELVELGLVRGISLLGAPYDFRKTPSENTEMIKNLKTLIENVYLNTSKPVIIICHSMGCLYTKYFLQQQTLTWKRKHLKDWITLSAPWAGTVKALKVYISGDNLDQYPLDAHKIRAIQRTYPSLSWLVPRVEYWPIDQTLVSTPLKNYTIRNLGNLFIDLGIPEAYEMWVDSRNLLDLMMSKTKSSRIVDDDFRSLGVTLHCLHGVNVSTPEDLNWLKLKDFPDKQPTITHGDGDGSVNLKSLSACTRFYGNHLDGDGYIASNFAASYLKTPPNDSSTYKTKIIHKMFHGVEHVHMLYDPSIIAYIKYVVTDGALGTNYPKTNTVLIDKTSSNASTASSNSSSTHPLFFPIEKVPLLSENLEKLTKSYEETILLSSSYSSSNNRRNFQKSRDHYHLEKADDISIYPTTTTKHKSRSTIKVLHLLAYYAIGIFLLLALLLFIYKMADEDSRHFDYDFELRPSRHAGYYHNSWTWNRPFRFFRNVNNHYENLDGTTQG